MPTAGKLPSGSWPCQVYSHTEEILQKDGSVKKKRIYKSFTSNISGPKGKRKAERLAADFAAEKESHQTILNCTLGGAIDIYIASKDSVLSPTTIADYKKKRKSSFKMLIDIPLKNLTKEMLQEAVNQEAKRRKRKSQLRHYQPRL